MPVMGTAGGSLANSRGWLGSGEKEQAAAAVGRDGELRTAKLIGDGRGTVLHDLYIPNAGDRANIDHAIVSGDRVLIVDSKVWKPGFYWTLGGQSRRGLERIKFAEKKTMEMAFDRTQRMLRNAGLSVEMLTPVLVVWPSRHGTKVTSWLLSIPGARVMTPGAFGSKAHHLMNSPANPRIVAALRRYLVSK